MWKLAITLLLCSASAFAQMNTGQIAGGIKDQLGGVLPGASIVAEHIQTGQEFKSTSNDAGEFLLAPLPVGSYSVKAQALNFKPVVRSVEVHAGENLRYDFTLQVGDSSDV